MKLSLAGALALGVVVSFGTAAYADPPGDPKAVKSEDGKYLDAQGDPTYNVKPDGTVDWYTFSGYRRYHSECHVCHGPNGAGSTYAPALKDSVKRFNYAEFAGIVIGGRQNGSSVMPSFADNKNASCYITDLYVYLRGLSTGAVPAGRPEKKDEKPKAFTEAETACMNAK